MTRGEELLSMSTTMEHLTSEQLRTFQQDGYLVLRGLLAPTEVQALVNNFMKMHEQGPIPGYFEPVPAEQANGDILKQYPRIMHPHRFNELALRYLLDPRLANILEDLFGEEPLAAQSMLYFKPAGGRGQ